VAQAEGLEESTGVIAISTKGRYSVRILIMMGSQPKGRLFTKQEIADAEELSGPYVQQLMMLLRAAGLVAGRRGKVGGFALAQAADSISVSDVLKATEGQFALAPCLGNTRCEREKTCPVRPVWRKANQLLEDFLRSVTIAELVDGGASDSLAGFDEALGSFRDIWDPDRLLEHSAGSEYC
jgi:Rrf2 family iron-sulfur cluster assembly transcriptional regulator